MSENCNVCEVTDNESHRLNKWSDTNQTNHTEKLDFQHIYADDNDVLNPILFYIENVWDLK